MKNTVIILLGTEDLETPGHYQHASLLEVIPIDQRQVKSVWKDIDSFTFDKILIFLYGAVLEHNNLFDIPTYKVLLLANSSPRTSLRDLGPLSPSGPFRPYRKAKLTRTG